ncbi:DUF2867 domain-containing protein [Flavobacterium sp.]|uniref:DUF2867 domain-containing protein n=1 Tax=Flavobacterium sp. TaxID=239 RepID=UPI004048317A
MKVKTEIAPETALIKEALPKVDFTDTFSTTNHQDTLENITNLIFGKEPKWVTLLFKIRNSIVKLFGLKTEMPKNVNTHFKVGSYIGFFQIFNIIENEVLLGADDSHLKFRVSIFNSQEKDFNIKVTTLVQYNNTFGKIYMTIIKPFHCLVVKSMIKNAHKSN